MLLLSVLSVGRLSVRQQHRSGEQREPKQQLSEPRPSQWCLAPQQSAPAWAAVQVQGEGVGAPVDLPGVPLVLRVAPGWLPARGMLAGRALIVHRVGRRLMLRVLAAGGWRLPGMRMQQERMEAAGQQRQQPRERRQRSAQTPGASSRCSSSSNKQHQQPANQAGAGEQPRLQQQLLRQLQQPHLKLI